MNRKSFLAIPLAVLCISYTTYSFSDTAEEKAAPATAAQEEASAPATANSAPEQTVAPKAEATTAAVPVAPAAEQAPVAAPAPAAPVTEPAPVAAPAPAAPAEVQAAATEASATNIPNPYTNVSNPEFYLLQELTSELKADANKGLQDAQARGHAGRYGEGNYIEMLKSFAEAAGTLDTTVRTAPVDIRKVHMSIKALKTLVVDLDDVFVYNPGYLNQIRNWNECKRVLRRIDGTVYREGGFRRVERIWDSNQFFRDVGKFLNVHGLFSGVDDQLHRTNPTGPMDTLVGRHGGGRRVAHVWMLPSSTYNSKMTNDRSTFNEGVQQY